MNILRRIAIGIQYYLLVVWLAYFDMNDLGGYLLCILGTLATIIYLHNSKVK